MTNKIMSRYINTSMLILIAGLVINVPCSIGYPNPIEGGSAVTVTNNWTNRLIGDQGLKDTSGYYDSKGSKPGKKMPAWYVNNEPMPDGPRSTFTT